MTDYIDWILTLVEEEEAREATVPDETGWDFPLRGGAVLPEETRFRGRGVRGGAAHGESSDVAAGLEPGAKAAPKSDSWKETIPLSGEPRAAGELRTGLRPQADRAENKNAHSDVAFFPAGDGGIFTAIKQRTRQVRQSERLGRSPVWAETRGGNGIPTTSEPAALDLAFQRDARRYDGAFTLY